jgi:hypothetical protein
MKDIPKEFAAVINDCCAFDPKKRAELPDIIKRLGNLAHPVSPTNPTTTATSP